MANRYYLRYWTEKLQKPCIDHMSNTEWEKVIDKAMEKTFEEKKDKIIQKAAKNLFDLEWGHSMEKNEYNPDPKKSTFSQIMEKSINKSFATVFKEKFIGIFQEVYATAIDKFMLSDNSSLVWEVEEWFPKQDEHINYRFDEVLAKEVEASKPLVFDEIDDLVRDEFEVACRKKIFYFQNDVHEKMLECNIRRKKWALQKLNEIQNTFKNNWPLKDMEEFMEDNQLQIEKIFTQYINEIENAFAKFDGMKSYFCFTDYINTYPNLDFLDKDHAHRKASTEQMIKDDRYAQLIESLWLELDVEREKCCCHPCIKEYCKIDCTDCTCNDHSNFHQFFFEK